MTWAPYVSFVLGVAAHQLGLYMGRKYYSAPTSVLIKINGLGVRVQEGDSVESKFLS